MDVQIVNYQIGIVLNFDEKLETYLINYQFSQKLKLLGNCEFNNLTNIWTLPLRVGLAFPLISGAQHMGFFKLFKWEVERR